MGQKLRVAVGSSALELIRGVRTGDYEEARFHLGHADVAEARAWLPSQVAEHGDDACATDDAVGPCDVGVLGRLRSAPKGLGARDAAAPETLEDIGFPFDEVVANRGIPPWRREALGRLTAEAPLELGIFSRSTRQSRKTLRTRTLDRHLPASSLIELDPSFYVASPELVCLQLADRLDAPRLALVIMEFTGSWSEVPPGVPSGSVVNRFGLAPVTTTHRIGELARGVRYLRGRNTLDRALSMALPGSASRPEAVVALMMSTPVEHGGYGMGTPLLNPRIEPPAQDRDHVTQGSYYPDIFFQECFVDLEYDSLEFHFDLRPLIVTASDGAARDASNLDLVLAAHASRMIDDRRRARDLQALGVHVIPVTNKDLASRRSLDQVVWAFARHLARRDDMRGMSLETYLGELDRPEYRDARDALFEAVA